MACLLLMLSERFGNIDVVRAVLGGSVSTFGRRRASPG
jgi:hypothetical protein